MATQTKHTKLSDRDVRKGVAVHRVSGVPAKVARKVKDAVVFKGDNILESKKWPYY